LAEAPNVDDAQNLKDTFLRHFKLSLLIAEVGDILIGFCIMLETYKKPCTVFQRKLSQLSHECNTYLQSKHQKRTV
jgi:hypothetical protein